MGSVPALTACRQRPHCLRGLDIKVQRRRRGGRREERGGEESEGQEGRGKRRRRGNEGSRGMEAECAKENKQEGMLKRENDRKTEKEAGVPGLTQDPRLSSSIVFPTSLSVSD